MEATPIDILDGYYKAFINLDDQRDFFVGFADYFDFANAMPAFRGIAANIYAPKKKLEKKLEKLSDTALKKLTVARGELQNYVTKEKIQNGWIDGAFKNYDGWLTGKVVGSSSLPDALHDQLRDVVEVLYRMPEQKPGQAPPLPDAAKHKVFAEKYIQFNESKTLVHRYLPIKEVFDFIEAENEYKTQRNTALWGQLEHLSILYNAIKTGKERHKKLVEKHQKDHSAQVAWDIMNNSVVAGEWLAIEENGSHSPSYFFKISKVRPWMARLHNYIAANYTINSTVEAIMLAGAETVSDAPDDTTKSTKQSKSRLLIEKNKKGTAIGFLQSAKHAKKLKIGEADSRKFKLVQCLFSAEGTIDAPYHPVAQGYERVFEAIRQAEDASNGKLKDFATQRAEKLSIIKGTIKEIRRNKELQKRIDFVWNNDLVRMEVRV